MGRTWVDLSLETQFTLLVIWSKTFLEFRPLLRVVNLSISTQEFVESKLFLDCVIERCSYQRSLLRSFVSKFLSITPRQHSWTLAWKRFSPLRRAAPRSYPSGKNWWLGTANCHSTHVSFIRQPSLLLLVYFQRCEAILFPSGKRFGRCSFGTRCRSHLVQLAGVISHLQKVLSLDRRAIDRSSCWRRGPRTP